MSVQNDLAAYPEAFDQSLAEVTWKAGGLLRCETCGVQGPLHARYWRVGWPKHCGYTMRWWTQRQLDAGQVPEIEDR